MKFLNKTCWICLVFCICVKGQTQPCAAINLGTKTLYAAPANKATPPPPGYRPVFINYVSRHGARHLTKPVSSSFAWSIMKKAEQANALTAQGLQLHTLLNKLEAVEKGNVKNISIEGVQEQQAIAGRMFAQNKRLFAKPVHRWKAEITKEIRTRQTAVAFIEALQQQIGKKDSINYVVNDTTLRFFDLSPAYLQFEESGTWKKDLQELKKTLQMGTLLQETISRWFNPDFAKKLSATDQEKLVADVYGFYSILPSVQNEATERGIAINIDSIGQLLPCKMLEKLSHLDIAEDYLAKGPGTNANGIQIKIAAPLLADFINATDAYIQTKNEPLALRFCHAETIAPFTALLSLSGADKAVTNITTFNSQVWNAAAVVPLSANVQWVLYKPTKGNRYLLKCLLNEKETKIDGLATRQFPYYEWQSVRTFYMNKLKQLHLSLTENGYQYLQNLK